MSELKLNPCPFCESENTAVCGDGTEELYGVECEDCGYMLCSFFSIEEAVEAWNRTA